jgi:hypothetical protein
MFKLLGAGFGSCKASLAFSGPILPQAGKNGKKSRFDQLQFARPRHALNLQFAFHGGGAVRLFFDINQAHRTALLGVPGAPPSVMHLDPPPHIRSPAGLERLVGTLDNININRRWFIIDH